MKILVLNGSPRRQGNTAAMVGAFVDGAAESGHEVTVVNVCQKKIAEESKKSCPDLKLRQRPCILRSHL